MITGLKMKYLWLFGLGVAIALCGWFCWRLALFNPETIVMRLEMLHTVTAIAIFLGLQIGATAIGIPGTVLVIAGGVVFGLVLGTVLSVIGATLGAIAAFWLARYCFRDRLRHRFRHHPLLKSFNRTLCNNPLACVLAIRFAPLSPFNLVNFLFGVTPLPLRPYAIGTGLGIIPGTIAYTWLGVTGAEALQSGQWPPLVGALLLLAALSLLPIWVKRRWGDRPFAPAELEPKEFESAAAETVRETTAIADHDRKNLQ